MYGELSARRGFHHHSCWFSKGLPTKPRRTDRFAVHCFSPSGRKQPQRGVHPAPL